MWVGWDGVQFIEKQENGEKDFGPIIKKALELGGYPEDHAQEKILVGFGHHAVLDKAEAIVNAVRTGKVRHFS